MVKTKTRTKTIIAVAIAALAIGSMALGFYYYGNRFLKSEFPGLAKYFSDEKNNIPIKSQTAPAEQYKFIGPFGGYDIPECSVMVIPRSQSLPEGCGKVVEGQSYSKAYDEDGNFRSYCPDPNGTVGIIRGPGGSLGYGGCVDSSLEKPVTNETGGTAIPAEATITCYGDGRTYTAYGEKADSIYQIQAKMSGASTCDSGLKTGTEAKCGLKYISPIGSQAGARAIISAEDKSLTVIGYGEFKGEVCQKKASLSGSAEAPSNSGSSSGSGKFIGPFGGYEMPVCSSKTINSEKALPSGCGVPAEGQTYTRVYDENGNFRAYCPDSGGNVKVVRLPGGTMSFGGCAVPAVTTSGSDSPSSGITTYNYKCSVSSTVYSSFASCQVGCGPTGGVCQITTPLPATGSGGKFIGPFGSTTTLPACTKITIPSSQSLPTGCGSCVYGRKYSKAYDENSNFRAYCPDPNGSVTTAQLPGATCGWGGCQ